MINRQTLLLTKMRLKTWGRWCHIITTSGLNYHRQSLIARLQKERGIIIRSTNASQFPHNADAEEVEEAIQCLAKQAPEDIGKTAWAQAVRIHYTMFDRPHDFRIDMAQLKRNTYYRYLAEGEAWIAEYLHRHH